MSLFIVETCNYSMLYPLFVINSKSKDIMCEGSVRRVLMGLRFFSRQHMLCYTMFKHSHVKYITAIVVVII